MSSKRQSDIFKAILMLWNVSGLFRADASKIHKYCSYVNIFINQVLYNLTLTINLWFAPRKIEYFIPEVIFYFTEIAVMSKVFMVIIMRDRILEAFNIMDGKDLEADDEASKKIVERDHANFSTFWKCFNVISQMAFFSLIILPVILHYAMEAELKLPVSQYYFLTDEFRVKCFKYLYMYQGCSIFVHIIYNISVDSFVGGLLLTGVTQLRVLNKKLKNLKLNGEEKMLSVKSQDEIQTVKLRNLLIRYGVILKYLKIVQHIISFNMFVVFGLSSVIICVTLCELLFLPTAVGFFICMIMYLLAMLLQIFIPAFLGSLINFESTELVFAAYCAEWVSQSESFKKNLRMFIERANSPIQIRGLKMFTMSLSSFTSIVRTAYSFFALIRNFQE